MEGSQRNKLSKVLTFAKAVTWKFCLYAYLLPHYPSNTAIARIFTVASQVVLFASDTNTSIFCPPLRLFCLRGAALPFLRFSVSRRLRWGRDTEVQDTKIPTELHRGQS